MQTDEGRYAGASGEIPVQPRQLLGLNYAEWESAELHTAALTAPGEGIGSPSPLWERVQKYPGMTGGGVHRYTPALSMEPGAGGQGRGGGGMW